MEAFFWAALGMLAAAAAGGAAFVGFRAWRAWQAFVSFAAGGAAGFELLSERVVRLSETAERTSGRAVELAAAVERLQRSTGRARTLVGATGELRAFLRAVGVFVPR